MKDSTYELYILGYLKNIYPCLKSNYISKIYEIPNRSYYKCLMKINFIGLKKKHLYGFNNKKTFIYLKFPPVKKK